LRVEKSSGLFLQLATPTSHLTVFARPYPKAIINPITAPRMVLMYGLQVKPQVLPIFMETRLTANPMTAPMTGPRITFKAMTDFPFYNTFLTIFSS
jgi:hypothetical protein